MRIGLLVRPHSRSVLSKKRFRGLSKKMHDRFHEKFSSTCCRVLIEPYDKDKKGRSQFCSNLTSVTASLAAELLLESNPELAKNARMDYLTSRDSKISDFFKKNHIRHVSLPAFEQRNKDL